MKTWLRGKRGGLAAFLLIAGLVAGGLGWATAAALRLEREQREQRAEAERANRLAVALWRLDTYAAPILAREDNRPFDHYAAVHLSPLLSTNSTSNTAQPNWNHGAALELSPLLTARFDDWSPLHFQVDARGWKSPQVLEPDVKLRLERVEARTALANVTPGRAALLDELRTALPPGDILAAARERTWQHEGRDATLFFAQRRQGGNNDRNPNDVPDFKQQQALNPNLPNSVGPFTQSAEALLQKEEMSRFQFQDQLTQQSKRIAERRPRPFALNAIEGNNKKLLDPPVNWERSTEVVVTVTSLANVWLTGKDGGERLLALRLVRVEDREALSAFGASTVGLLGPLLAAPALIAGRTDHEVCQGVVFDVERLRAALAEKVQDLFPSATLTPVRDADEAPLGRAMTSLPFQLDPGPLVVPPEPGWTPLRVGLTLAWTAALVALLAVGLGGWSLLDLSERRIRFVSAVTHELRTPLTTLRLYLDMLLGGLVRDEKQRREYLETLHAEADRLTRLVGNVLDFSRLENQRPRLNRTPVQAATLLSRVRDTWEARCRHADKELVVEDALGEGAVLETDADLLLQVLGNLIDNACKYSRGADDRHVWLRARREGGRVVFEVVDRGPGVPAGDRRAIFRAFRRGDRADVTAGGVGLGLALARRWARLLGGKLALGAAPAEGGASFQVWLPAPAVVAQ